MHIRTRTRADQSCRRSVAAWFLMTDRPDTAKWLTEEEKAMCAARIKADNIGSTVVLDSAKSKVWLSGALNPTVCFALVK